MHFKTNIVHWDFVRVFDLYNIIYFTLNVGHKKLLLKHRREFSLHIRAYFDKIKLFNKTLENKVQSKYLKFFLKYIL